MKKIFFTTLVFFLIAINASAQNELKNWYFGNGTDGITFVNNVPQKLSNKYPGLGFEGMVVVNDPLTGDLLFYSDGEKVINKNHVIMTNGSGMTGNYSGAQSVQCCPIPGSCYKKFYLFTNSAWDNTAGAISYSIIDFTTDPLGTITNKNTLFWNGPSDQAMTLINKPGTQEYWLIANAFTTAQYYVWPLTSVGIGTPVTYSFSNTGTAYQMNYDKTAKKISVTGGGNKLVTLINFDANTGILSNEIQLAGSPFAGSAATRFSPDGTKLYAGLSTNTNPNPTLYQYDFNTSAWTNMNTCCYAHDLKLGPDNKMYHIHTYNSTQPIAVIDFPNLSAVGNACNYHTLTFASAFNGEVRRFPETVILPLPPSANTDIVSITGTSKIIPVLNNDFDAQGGVIHIDAIVALPKLGTAVISGNNINYTANQNYCDKSDTLIYRIANNDCATDTTMVIINFPQCLQFCTGTLGAPIVNVTFGNGATNPGPALASGTTTYTYTPASGTPPSVINDGFYSIVNQVPSNATPGWFTGSPDHTNDANGYMAFFNASINPGTFYQKTITGLCPNTTYQFAAWIANIENASNVAAVSLPNVSFNIIDPNTNTILSAVNTGNIPNPSAMTWKQYSTLFTMPSNLNSVLLSLTNNNPGGAGNDLVIDDITFSPCGPTTIASINKSQICIGDSAKLIGSVAGGLHTPVYLWQMSKDTGKTFTDIVGASTLSYSLLNLPAGYYQFKLLSAENGNINAATCRFVSDTVSLRVTNCNPPYCAITNAINISSGYNSTSNTLLTQGQKDSNWVVTDMSLKMQNALCYGSALSAQAPPSATLYPPVPFNQYSYATDGPTGFISCYPYVTIYTKDQPNIPSTGAFEYTMNVHRNFYITSTNATENVLFNFTITCDDAIDSVIIDKGKSSQIIILSTLTKTVGSGNPYNVNRTISLAPGLHTIDIKCLDWQDPIGGYYFPVTENGQTSPHQWNPFGVNVTGTITAASSVLQNKKCCTDTYKTIDTTICPGSSIFGHTTQGTYKDTLKNAGGCDSIITTTLHIVAGCKCNYSNINISTGYNPNTGSFLTAGQRDSSWIITAMSDDMKNAFSNSNTNSPVSPSGVTTAPVNIGVPAWTVQNFPSPWIQSDVYLSCFPFNTIYTIPNATRNVTNCTMEMRRDFYINSSNNENVTFNFNVSTDDATRSILIDAGSPGAIILYSGATTNVGLNPAYNINTTKNLAPGHHTITILAANQEDPNGTYFNLPSGNSAQWNPFGVAVSGTITSANNILQNITCCTATASTIDTTICQGKNFLGHTSTGNYKDTILNSTGCDSIITVKLTVKQVNISTGNDSTICTNSTITLHSTGTNITTYAWTPKLLLNDSTLQNPTAHIDSTVKFYVRVKNNIGCTVIDSVTYTVQFPKVVTNNDVAICKNKSVQLNTTGALTYSWSPATDLSADNISNPIASPSGNTQYIVTGTTQLGCKANDTVYITVNSLPIVKINNDTTICSGVPLQLNATGAVTYSWLPSASGLSNTQISNPIATINSPVQYTVTGTDANKCTATATINIGVDTKPIISKMKDSSICKNSSVQLFASGGTKYSWLPVATLDNADISNPTATPAVPTKYYVTVSGPNNCASKDSINISFKTAPVFSVSPNSNICGIVTTQQLNATGGDTYLWSPATGLNDPTIKNPVASPAITTQYTVHITSNTCNESTDLSTTVAVGQSILVKASKSNDIDCLHSTANLSASGAVKYEWIPPTGLSNPRVANPIAKPASTQQYIVKGTATDGCIGYDTVIVNAAFNPTNGIFIPTAFSPNGDGKNDCYKIFAGGAVSYFQLSIYNRLGEKVFYAENPADCWDGNYKGQITAGNYVYYLKAKTACGQVDTKGNIVLVH